MKNGYSQSTTIYLPSTTVDKTISLCRECADRELVREKRIQNLKAQTVAFEAMVLNKDSEIDGLNWAKEVLKRAYDIEKNKKPKFADLSFFQKLFALLKGALVGAVVAASVLVL